MTAGDRHQSALWPWKNQWMNCRMCFHQSKVITAIYEELLHCITFPVLISIMHEDADSSVLAWPGSRDITGTDRPDFVWNSSQLSLCRSCMTDQNKADIKLPSGSHGSTYRVLRNREMLVFFFLHSAERVWKYVPLSPFSHCCCVTSIHYITTNLK